ncbi:indole-3-glycerol phosphate synthase TrpC [Desertibacillus haloalkaliphilus]|uniref:indole-3-glycerol phosphate synthase TrpC n=1 Tax=Desertibacillus haloalkaliphilus TaxID=1328930 RepID=UPI001C261A92|nr:indole-3-glycerol phosphate synthase TrpC [Desertibacillus haloalkaliphilus]MBU8907251.1 indole-3-glycerol phosphate synthase TrpC [Desertibacillus haloalkaliphilus]
MLEKIIETKIEEIEHITLPESIDVPHFSLYDHITNSNRNVGLIAEVKKASPSKGIIRADFDPLTIAKGYERGGADAISVLTDQTYFQGHRDYLTAIKRVCNRPVMRKDFIISSIQIEESVRIGADAILLIAGIFEATKLQQLYEEAFEKGLECLVEVHSEEELEELLSVFTPKIIGVNNRNLKTFQTSLTQTDKMSRLIPEGSVFISESGIHTRVDLDRVEKAGAAGVLVGESLMRAETPEAGIHLLFGGENVASTS